MRISHVAIENFRNFKKCESDFGQNIILVGENKAGKSNFITALRLVLDPLQNRQLIADDFWDGEGQPFDGRTIRVTIQITNFGGNNPEIIPLTWLTPCLIQSEPEIAQLTYEFYPDADQENTSETKKAFTNDDYKWRIWGGLASDQEIRMTGIWQDMPIKFINALRDLASDSKVWSRSPLNELIKLSEDVNLASVQPYADEIADSSRRMVDKLLSKLETGIKTQLLQMVGRLYAVDPRLDLDTTNPDAILNALRVFVDGDHSRPLSRTSLGLQNAIYLSLLSLQLDKKQEYRNGKNKAYLPIIALEEPEAHLHPHLQRLVFKDFLLKSRKRKLPAIISSHSPHLVTEANIKDIVVVRGSLKTGSRLYSSSKVQAKLTPRQKKDLGRFMDITKSEMIFSKGILFVEGDVEVLLVNTFQTILNIDLDANGISVCNVYGAVFTHVVTLAKHLGIPFAVLTDGDKFNKNNGLMRGIKLLHLINSHIANPLKKGYKEDKFDAVTVRGALEQFGIFVNEWTIEPSLIESGLAEEFKLTFDELGDEIPDDVSAGVIHVNAYLANKTDENMKKILTAIGDSRWGKGRFAHRLCGHILKKSEKLDTDQRREIVPQYIQSAFEYLIKKVNPKDDF